MSYNKGLRSTNHQLRRERVLDASELATLPRGRTVMLSSGSPAALIETVPWMKGKHAQAVRASIAAHDPALPVVVTVPAAAPVTTLDPGNLEERRPWMRLRAPATATKTP